MGLRCRERRHHRAYPKPQATRADDSTALHDPGPCSTTRRRCAPSRRRSSTMPSPLRCRRGCRGRGRGRAAVAAESLHQSQDVLAVVRTASVQGTGSAGPASSSSVIDACSQSVDRDGPIVRTDRPPLPSSRGRPGPRVTRRGSELRGRSTWFGAPRTRYCEGSAPRSRRRRRRREDSAHLGGTEPSPYSIQSGPAVGVATSRSRPRPPRRAGSRRRRWRRRRRQRVRGVECPHGSTRSGRGGA